MVFARADHKMQSKALERVDAGVELYQVGRVRERKRPRAGATNTRFEDEAEGKEGRMLADSTCHV